MNSEVVPVVIRGRNRIESVLCHLKSGCIEAILLIAGDTVKALLLMEPSTKIAAPFAPARLFNFYIGSIK